MALNMIKKFVCVICVMAIVFSTVSHFNVHAYDDSIVDSFYVIDENDNIEVITISQDDLDEAKKEMEDMTYSVKVSYGDDEEVIGEYGTIEEAMDCYNENVELFNDMQMFSDNTAIHVYANDNVVATSSQVYGIVRFNRSKSTVTYTEVKTGNSGYISPASCGEAAYLKTEGGYVYAKLAGVVMKVKTSDVASINSYKNQTISFYCIKNGYLYHAYSYYNGSTLVSSSTKVGYPPSYMSSDAVYFSYDGHYFYKTFEAMIDDYLNGTYNHAINKDNPYYNYYQYISFHTLASYSASDYNEHIKSKNKKNSVMNNSGSSFVDIQNKYTVNSLLMLGIAINESGWGTSSLAINKNNIFGLNATDNNPYGNGNSFTSVKGCIDNFASGWITKGYLNGMNSRYRGPHLGDKNSGINIKYSSDPYWGEKAAARGYAAGLNDGDYGRYSIAIAQKIVKLYKLPSTSSQVLYTSSTSNDKVIYDYPLTVLDKVTINNEQFYKVRSDMPLKDNRSARDMDVIYDSARDYVFVKASDVELVFEGTGKDTYDSSNPEVPYLNEIPDLTAPTITNVFVNTSLALVNDTVELTIQAKDDRDTPLVAKAWIVNQTTKKSKELTFKHVSEDKYICQMTINDEFGYGVWKLTEIQLTDKSNNKTSIKDGKDSVDLSRCYFEILETPKDSANPFTDVRNPQKWYYNYILKVYELGLMSGTSKTTFSPEDNMTRGMIVTVLHRIAGKPSATYTSRFPDVKASSYCATAVEWAAKNKVVSGNSDGTFKPNDNITRQDVAVILYNYARSLGLDVSGTNLDKFEDKYSVSSYARDAMKWAVSVGILSGSTDKNTGKVYLNPRHNATRAECAKMLLVASEIYKK